MLLTKIIVENFIEDDKKVIDLNVPGYILGGDTRDFDSWYGFENIVWYIKLIRELILRSTNYLGDDEKIWFEGRTVSIPSSKESSLGSEPSIELWFQEDKIKYKYIISFLDSSIYFESLSVFNGDIIYYRVLEEDIVLNSKYMTKKEERMMKSLNFFRQKSVLGGFELGKKFKKILEGIAILDNPPRTGYQFSKFLRKFDEEFRYSSIDALNKIVSVLGYTKFNPEGTLTMAGKDGCSADIEFESIGSGFKWLSYLLPYLLLSKDKGNIIIVCYFLDQSLDVFISQFLYKQFIKNREVQLITRIHNLDKNGEVIHSYRF